jgi:hypothetical protein
VNPNRVARALALTIAAAFLILPGAVNSVTLLPQVWPGTAMMHGNAIGLRVARVAQLSRRADLPGARETALSMYTR